MFLLSLLGCEESLPEDTQVPDPDPPTGLVLRVEPVALDFGRVELGESRDKTVTITNKGDSLVFLAEFGFEDPGLTIESPGFHIQPSESVEVLVNWAPPYPGELEDTLQVLAGENPAELSPFEVTLEGHVDGPTMVIAKPNTDMGDVAVGCNAQETMRIVNSGTSDLVIDDLSLSGGGQWSLWGTEPNMPIDPLPWTIEPNGMQQFVVDFRPESKGLKYSAIEVSGSDPLRPTGEMLIEGMGVIDNDNEMSWELRANQNVTILFTVNEIAISQYYREAFEDALPIFFDTLKESGAHFRLAAILEETGEHDGSAEYIDHTWDTNEAVDEVFEMLSGQSQWGDNDSNLMTLDSAITVHREWLIDESSEWEQSKLNLIAINDDQDQSPNNFQQYLNSWYSLKENQEDIQLHAIAGTGQSSNQGCYAVYFGSYIDAVNATGGQLYEICDLDWETWMAELGEAVLGENQPVFELEGTPFVATIEVRLDGFLLTQHWSYESERNAVVFDEGHQPTSGTLTVYYLYTPDCSAE